MLYNIDVKRKCNFDRKRYLELYNQRKRRKSVYESDAGIEMLASDIINSGMFDNTNEDNSRNFIIQRLESMGILDEDNIKRIVKFMVEGTEIVPEPYKIGIDTEESDGQ